MYLSNTLAPLDRVAPTNSGAVVDAVKFAIPPTQATELLPDLIDPILDPYTLVLRCREHFGTKRFPRRCDDADVGESSLDRSEVTLSMGCNNGEQGEEGITHSNVHT